MTETPPPEPPGAAGPATDTPPDPAPGPAPGLDRAHLRSYERLERSRTDRKIAGVAGGLGRHLNVDPTILRVLFVVLVFFGGAGLVLYGVAWLLVPEEGREHGIVRSTPSTRSALLIVAGVFALLLVVGDAWGGVGFPWPLALVALVLLLVLAGRDRAAAPPASTPPPPGSAPPGAAPPGAGAAPGWGPPPPPPVVDRGLLLIGPTLALVAVTVGVLGLLDSGGLDVAASAYPALALAVIGAMLVLGSRVGRPGGLIALGLVATLVLAVTSAEPDWDRDVDLRRAPASAAAVEAQYATSFGDLELDLTGVPDLAELDGREVQLRAEAGEILVRVPDGLDVTVDARIRYLGDIDVDGVNHAGPGVELRHDIDGGAGAPRLTLDVDLALGSIVVVQEEAA